MAPAASSKGKRFRLVLASNSAPSRKERIWRDATRAFSVHQPVLTRFRAISPCQRSNAR